jgi:hypothetical protein
MAERTKQYVYFAGSDQEVKIGLAYDPLRRTLAMRTIRPNIELFGYIPGDREAEKLLHQRFSKDRIIGEWFHFTPELQAAIKELLNSDKEAVLVPDRTGNFNPRLWDEEARRTQREQRNKHFKNLKLYR